MYNDMSIEVKFYYEICITSFTQINKFFNFFPYVIFFKSLDIEYVFNTILDQEFYDFDIYFIYAMYNDMSIEVKFYYEICITSFTQINKFFNVFPYVIFLSL